MGHNLWRGVMERHQPAKRLSLAARRRSRSNSISTAVNALNEFASRGTESSRRRRSSNARLSDIYCLSPTESPHPATSSIVSHSPSMKTNITYPKRQYSLSRQDSLEQMETPVFTSDELRLRKATPSSASTVLIMAGLFVCGITTLFSGLIVLVQQREIPFVVAGLGFLAMGVSMLLACAMLQRKNIAKFVLDLDQDLYFLKMSDYTMWKMVFERRADPLEELDQIGKCLNASYLK